MEISFQSYVTNFSILSKTFNIILGVTMKAVIFES